MKKGFTLVELLAVITLLAILLIIGTSSISKILKENKQTLYDDQIASFVSSTETWAMGHVYELPDIGSSMRITLGDLIDEKYVKDNLENPLTGEAFPRDMYFCIRNANGTYVYTYEGDC